MYTEHFKMFVSYTRTVRVYTSVFVAEKQNLFPFFLQKVLRKHIEN